MSEQIAKVGKYSQDKKNRKHRKQIKKVEIYKKKRKSPKLKIACLKYAYVEKHNQNRKI